MSPTFPEDDFHSPWVFLNALKRSFLLLDVVTVSDLRSVLESMYGHCPERIVDDIYIITAAEVIFFTGALHTSRRFTHHMYTWIFIAPCWSHTINRKRRRYWVTPVPDTLL